MGATSGEITTVVLVQVNHHLILTNDEHQFVATIFKAPVTAPAVAGFPSGKFRQPAVVVQDDLVNRAVLSEFQPAGRGVLLGLGRNLSRGVSIMLRSFNAGLESPTNTLEKIWHD